MNAPFGDRLARAVRATAPVAVGVDPHLDRLPLPLRERWRGLAGADFRRAAGEAVRDFGRMVVAAVRGRVAAIKPQLAFYEALGAPGLAALEDLCARARAAGLLVIADGKRGDIASTAAAYARAFLDPAGPLAADALTVNPWMGTDTLEPYLPACREHGRGLFVLARTTNPGSAEFQAAGHPPAAERLAAAVERLGAPLVGESGTGALGLVVGAGIPDEARRLRALAPSAWFLVPGVGAQGGSVADALAGARPDGLGALAVAARSVLFPPEPPGERARSYETAPEKFVQEQAERLARSAISDMRRLRDRANR